MTALGYMAELVRGTSNWFSPTLMGMPADNPAVLPYWLGAWAMQMAPNWLDADFAARLPFIALLSLTMIATWYGTYYLARSPLAQPVPFAFGGEALPADYARAMADGALLALMACLGLAQLSHETSPALVQLGCFALFFYGMAALPFYSFGPAVAAVLGLLGLALSGAPSLALLFGLGGSTLHFLDRTREARQSEHLALESFGLMAATLAITVLAWSLDLLRWKIQLPQSTLADWNGYAQLLVWFTWPAWPLALWTVWRWRRQLFNRRISRHVALPGGIALVCTIATLTTGSADRTLLLVLPALASLAAFALPTLKRQMAAVIDWFTLLFFTGCAITVWVVWIAMQTGFPWQPAANVERLAPGFVPHFSPLAFVLASIATLSWAWLVRWRVGRHQAAIWTSLVLPAGGATLSWLLVMTLWMPLLNYAQSYTALVRRTTALMQDASCAESVGLGLGQIAAFEFYGRLRLVPMQTTPSCPWLLVEPQSDLSAPSTVNTSQWILHETVRHPVDRAESVLLFKRK